MGDAKAQMRIDHALDDAFINGLIVAARQWVEAYLWRALVTQTWLLTLNQFPIIYWGPYHYGMYPTRGTRTISTVRYDDIDGVWPYEIRLPKGDVQTVSFVNYDDVNQVQQTFPSTNYIVDGYPPARIILKSTQSWPTTSPEANSVRIQYVVGYGAAAAVPQAIKQAVMLLVSQMYEHRVPEVERALSPVAFSCKALLEPYRLSRAG